MKEVVYNQGYPYEFDEEQWFVKVGDVVAMCYKNTYECGVVTKVNRCCCSIYNAFSVDFVGFRIGFLEESYDVFDDFDFHGGSRSDHILKMDMTAEQFESFKKTWKRKINVYNRLFKKLKREQRKLMDDYDFWKKHNLKESNNWIYPFGTETNAIYKEKDNKN